MRRIVPPLLVLSIVSLSFSSNAFARNHRVDDVPNATNTLFNPNGGECGLCHVDETGDGPLTSFGSLVSIQVEDSSEPSVPWDVVYEFDSDRDGYSNGLELGDPTGSFMMGDADPEGTITDPNDPNSNLCGDGVFHEDAEECDPGLEVTAVCADEGYGPGVVGCTDQCILNFSECDGFDPEPMNNTNNSNNANNSTNNQTNNNTNNTNQTGNNENNDNNTNPTNNNSNNTMGTEDDDAGCATSPTDPSLWFVLVGWLLVRRNRRR